MTDSIDLSVAAPRIPDPHEIVDLTMSDGAIIRLRRHGNPNGARIVLSHGNGFAIDGYFPFWRRLLDDFDVVVFDQRNHGPNPRHENHSYRQIAHDAEAIHTGLMEALGIKPTAGVFHSMSAVANIHASVSDGVRWDALVLIDPANIPPQDHPAHEDAERFEFILSGKARNRVERFADPMELATRFKTGRMQRRWVPEGAELMARAVTRRAPDGGYELACPREFEARIYEGNVEMGTWPLLPRLPAPVLFIAADPTEADAMPSKMLMLATEAFGLNTIPMPGASHMLQIEKPEECVDGLRKFLGACGFA